MQPIARCLLTVEGISAAEPAAPVNCPADSLRPLLELHYAHGQNRQLIETLACAMTTAQQTRVVAVSGGAGCGATLRSVPAQGDARAGNDWPIDELTHHH